MILAGTVSTSTTLAWAFHELARRPEVEAQVQAEADEVTAAGPVGSEALPNLAHIGRVMNEVTRLYSAVVVMRRAITPVEIGGVRLPAGSEVAYSLYALHRDPRFYPRAEQFDPDRWLPGRSVPPKGAFIPFGIGNHKCIGDSFAWTEMLIAVAIIAARWRLVPSPGHTLREMPAILPRPGGLQMIAVPRKSPPTAIRSRP